MRLITAACRRWLSLLILQACCFPMVKGGVSCKEGSNTCSKALYPGSECVNGFCSNPFQQGCLYSLLNNDNNGNTLSVSEHVPHSLLQRVKSHKRVCNSEDPPDAEEKGICSNYRNDPSHKYLVDDYKEVRIHGQNWGSSMVNAWMMQMILSELLMVPASVETGQFNQSMGFYDPHNSIEWSLNKVDHVTSLENAAKAPNGDCLRLPRTNDSIYQPCAHVIPEFWDDDGEGQTMTGGIEEMEHEGIIERPHPMGAVGYKGLYVTKFTVPIFPAITSYVGLMEKQNRQQLAELLKFPTTFGEYCETISNTSCSLPDEYAKQRPRDAIEAGRYHVPGIFQGYFRQTSSNDCAQYPDTCSGHVADALCRSTMGPSLLMPWIHHFEMPLTRRLYTTSQIYELWDAANATNSHLIAIGRSPSIPHSRYMGTDSELVRITFPTPTEECRAARQNYTQVNICDKEDDSSVIFGSPHGICDYSPYALQLIVTKSLETASKPANIPTEIHSPAFDAISSYQMTHLQMSDILQTWGDQNVDPNGFDPRLATCLFLHSHLEEILFHVVPKTYPRIVEQHFIYEIGLNTVALVIGSLATAMTIGAAILVFIRRETTVIKYAQVDFLFILLLGLFLVSCSSIVNALEPTTASCLGVVWLLELGYILELVPLAVKITAINRLMAAAKKMRRIQIKRTNLFGIVAIFTLATIIGLIVWTVLDPPLPRLDFFLQDDVNHEGDTIIEVQRRCSSESDYWLYTAMVIHLVLLLWAAVLAFQMRRIPQRFRESTVLAAVIYTQAAFVASRLVLMSMPPDLVSPVINTTLVSILTGLDSMTTLCIYFIPKLFLYNKDTSESLTASTLPQQWPPSASRHGQAGLATSGVGGLPQGSESDPATKNDASYHQTSIPLSETLRQCRAENRLLREEMDMATILVAELRAQKESLKCQVQSLMDGKAEPEGLLGLLEDKVELLKSEESKVERPPLDEKV